MRLDDGVEQFTLQQRDRGPPVQNDVVKWIGEYLRCPRQRAQRPAEKDQMHGAECQAADSQGQSHEPYAVEVSAGAYAGLDQPEQIRTDREDERAGYPDAEEHRLAPHVVAHLDRFLLRVRGVVHAIETPWLEENVARLASHHAYTPSEESGGCRVDEQQTVRNHETAGAQEM